MIPLPELEHDEPLDGHSFDPSQTERTEEEGEKRWRELKKERSETDVIVAWSMMDLEGAGKERERKGDTEQ